MKHRLVAALGLCLPFAAGVPAQQLKPQTVSDFECYVKTAEARMAARKQFLFAEADPALFKQIVSGQKLHLVSMDNANPKKITGALLFDSIGTIYIPGATVDRTVRMLKDYNNRAQYFVQTIAASKLNCRSGDNHFGVTMRLKEPALIDETSDVVWERVDEQRWTARSYATKVQEIEKQRGYLLRLYTYWRVARVENGVVVEGEAITMSGEFSAFKRALGSFLMGISPEKSLRNSLQAMRDTLAKPGLEFSAPPTGLPECGEAYRPAGCVEVSAK